MKRMNELSSLADEFLADEEGAVSVELVLIIVVLIALVTAFKSSITSTLSKITEKIGKNADAI